MSAPEGEPDRALRPDPLTAHDGFLHHPVVHAYVSMRTLGNLHRHVESVIGEIRARTGPAARVFSLALRGAGLELEVARALPDREFDVIDRSAERVEIARSEAARLSITNVRIEVGDPGALELDHAAYDVVTGQYSMHYVEPLEAFWHTCFDALRPGGVVLAQEYVGPNRLQWAEARVAAADSALEQFVPDEHKPHHRRMHPGIAAEILRDDPLTAARSADLPGTCREAGFEIVTFVGGGCALLHPVLLRQIHTFDPTNWEHNWILSRLFAEEARLMDAGVLGHDFAMFIARRP